MKCESTFQWHIYICFRVCKKHYYSIIHRRLFKKFVFGMSARTDAQYNSSPFFIARPSCWKTHFSFAGPALWKILDRTRADLYSKLYKVRLILTYACLF